MCVNIFCYGSGCIYWWFHLKVVEANSGAMVKLFMYMLTYYLVLIGDCKVGMEGPNHML
jgi:hypothetical protein